jgi:F-type H+-transporting ATPase subunit b
MLVMLAGADVAMTQTPEFWVAVAFFLFLAMLAYYGVPRLIGRALDDRAAAIRKELDEARRLREEAQALLADYQKKRQQAEAEAKGIVDSARVEAENLAKETRRSLGETLERRTKQAEDKISRAEAQAVGEVRIASVEAAIAAAETLIKSKVAGATGAQLIEQGIRDIKGRLN